MFEKLQSRQEELYKRLDTGEWVEGAFYAFYNFKRVVTQILRDRTNGVPDALDVDPATVGEFTGLHDKNGKKIFEDDVVACSMIGSNYNPPQHWNRKQVVFERGAFCLEERSGDTVPLRDYATGIEIEVIGNIHDHPALQEVKK